MSHVGQVGVCICCAGPFFLQAEDVIRDLVRSRGLGDVYKRQLPDTGCQIPASGNENEISRLTRSHAVAAELTLTHRCRGRGGNAEFGLSLIHI